MNTTTDTLISPLVDNGSTDTYKKYNLECQLARKGVRKKETQTDRQTNLFVEIHVALHSQWFTSSKDARNKLTKRTHQRQL